MFRIIDRYVGRNVVIWACASTMGLVALSSLIKFVDQLRNVGRGDYDMAAIAEYVSWTVPGQICMFFPMGVLIGTVLALGNLASSSELIVMQGLGKSRLGIVSAACFWLLPVVLTVFLMGEFVVPDTEKKAESVHTAAISGGQVAVTSRGIWFREGNSFISIARVLTDGSLDSVYRYDFSASLPKQLLRYMVAKKGVWQDGKWHMTDVAVYSFGTERVIKEFPEAVDWELHLTPEKLDVVGVGADEFSIRGLISYIDYITQNGQKADRYYLDLYRKIIAPFMSLVILLLAASTVFGPLRSATMGARVVVGIIVGFAFYAVNEILAPFTIFWGIPPVLCAVLPTLLMLSVGIYLLKRSSS
ncbi:LPS export ABC transporter permease LptG [Succinimonas amylolytica]|uniref:LPS export ABC transporter permease LptG n=1 Tax=Succinimonas amylolytica TaxID=83769 RepID=UPI00036336A0|nr:LPS export ABC transporter permease LptG [Succinimonas amylolytica]